MRSAVPVVLCLMLTGVGELEAVTFNDKAVAEAIKRATEFLWRSQQPNGSWGSHGRGGRQELNHTGQTALAVYALLESGINPQDPRMDKALKWLASQSEEGTYALALRCNVWEVANRSTPGKYSKLLQADAARLWAAGARNGRYNYPARPGEKRWDNSNSQYGLLGVWAAAMANLEVPAQYWDVVRRHWESTQHSDGGWGYQAGGESTAAMVTGGVASLFVCYDEVYRGQFVRCGVTGSYYPRVKRGIDWLDKNFAATLRGQRLGHSDMFYYLYGVERVGLASGHKYFGKVDWYKEGATRLLNTQRGGSWNGKWGASVGTSFALVFLVRGRNAVILNKLEFEGDWNNRPRDLANLTRWMSRIFERTVNWQIINLSVPVSEWHDAPILYISGSQLPKFTDEHLRKLRTFVLQGGAIFSVTECGGTAGFKKGIRDTYKKLFPDHELTQCGKEHDIYSRRVHFDLPGRPVFHVLSNGVRPLAVHTDADLALSWQLRKTVTQQWAFHAASNVVRYITDRVSMVRPRGTTHWPTPYSGGVSRTVKLARLKHAGLFDPEPLAYERFSRLMAREAGTKVEVLGPMEIADLPGSGAKVATLTGIGKLSLSEADQTALKAWVENGGLLVVDAAGGSKAFGDSAEAILKKMFGDFRVRRLASMAPLFRVSGMPIDKVKYRRRTKLRLQQSTPNLKGVLLNGRLGAVFSREDLTAGLVGYPSWTVDGYAPESAFEIMRNVVLSAK